MTQRMEPVGVETPNARRVRQHLRGRDCSRMRNRSKRASMISSRFLADIDTLDLEGVVPASIFDPSWPNVNETRS